VLLWMRAQRMGEDGSEKLHYIPGVFTLARHIHGKWYARNAKRDPSTGAGALHR
jgi:hypothetical protein